MTIEVIKKYFFVDHYAYFKLGISTIFCSFLIFIYINFYDQITLCVIVFIKFINRFLDHKYMNGIGAILNMTGAVVIMQGLFIDGKTKNFLEIFKFNGGMKYTGNDPGKAAIVKAIYDQSLYGIVGAVLIIPGILLQFFSTIELH